MKNPECRGKTVMHNTFNHIMSGILMIIALSFILVFAAAEEDGQLPQVTLKGSMDGISKNHRILLGFEYSGGDSDPLNFECFAYTTWQGHSTLSNEKKNYTIRLFDDEALTMKHRLFFRNGWQLEHKYILKANYADISMVRNLCCTQLWADVVKTRPDLPTRLVNTSNYGAVSGFPVTLWHDGQFMGLYTLNLHKDDDLYDMREGRRDAIIICNGVSKPEALFKAETDFVKDVNDWEIEFCGTVDNDGWIREKFNRFIRFVMNADDDDFRNHLCNHANVKSLIDYYLFIEIMGLTDSAAKDLVFLSYEDGPWIATVYDMEDAFGLAPDGSSAKDPADFLPRHIGNEWTSGTDSLLWDRLVRCFPDEISGRFRQLRNDVLSDKAIMACISHQVSSIPQKFIEQDLALYPGRQVITNPAEQIEAYMIDRLKLLDRLFGR